MKNLLLVISLIVSYLNMGVAFGSDVTKCGALKPQTEKEAKEFVSKHFPARKFSEKHFHLFHDKYWPRIKKISSMVDNKKHKKFLAQNKNFIGKLMKPYISSLLGAHTVKLNYMQLLREVKSYKSRFEPVIKKLSNPDELNMKGCGGLANIFAGKKMVEDETLGQVFGNRQVFSNLLNEAMRGGEDVVEDNKSKTSLIRR